MALFKPFGFYKPKVIAAVIPTQPEATAFLTTTGITDPTISTAINTLVYDLKQAGVWSKMIAIYPIVGGTATTHKYNLKNTSTFTINFVGGGTHSSNGYLGNGSNGVGYTGIRIGTDITQNNAYGSVYERTTTGSGVSYGGVSSGNGIQLTTQESSTNLSYHKLMNGGTHYTLANTDSSGFWQQSRTVSTSYYVQQNTTRNTASVASQTPPATAEYIALMALGTSINTAVAYANKQQAYAAFGEGLSTTEMDDHYTAVLDFQTTLGRNV